MKKKLVNPPKPIFNPQDRYYINAQGWWFYTAEMISGPYNTKPECVDSCRRYIQQRDGVMG